MNEYFKKEDQRKDQLFAAWKKFLTRVHIQLSDLAAGGDIEFDELYEGIASISHLTKNCMNLQLETGKMILQLNLGPEICKHSRRSDSLYLVIGFYQKRWWPLEVLSLGSAVTAHGEFHMSINPEYIEVPELGVMQ